MKHYIYLLPILFIVYGCSSDDDNSSPKEPGSIEDIKNWANPEIVDAVKNLGFTIHEGNNPPNIEGDYEISPRILEATNIQGDYQIGSIFYKINISFSNQDNTTLTVNFIGKELDNSGNVYATQLVDNYLENSYIIGNGNKFTSFFKVTVNRNDKTAQVLNVFSGEITENGISSIQNGVIMLENFDQDSYFIQNNTGRIFKDSDGMAERL